jgi:heme-degrading monooxygenase HmoA
MIRATLRMRVRAGGEEAFEAAWRSVAAAASCWPGNLRQDLLRDATDSRRYVVTSDWSSLEAFRAFETSPRQEVLTAPLRALREAVQMTVDDLLAHVEGERGDGQEDGQEVGEEEVAT